MNHHLRFLFGMIALSSATMLLSSCSLNSAPEPPPEVALKKGQIRYRLHIFTTDENIDVTNSFRHTARIAGIYSSDEGKKLLQRYQKNKKFHLDIKGSIIGGQREKVSYSQLTNFRYATEYDPPVYSKNPSLFPVTPTTPSKFETKQLGTKVYFTGRRISEETLSLSLQLDKNSFLGNVNYGTPITTEATDFWGRKVSVIVSENKLLVPVFRNFKLNSDIKLLNGHYLIIEGNGSPSSKTQQLLEKDSGPVEEANFVALIQVEAAL